MTKYITEDEARLLDYCPCCGAGTPSGDNMRIVCWDCWKYSENSLKHSDLDTDDWLKIYAKNWKTVRQDFINKSIKLC